MRPRGVRCGRTTSTARFALDSATDALYRLDYSDQYPTGTSTGTLSFIGPLGVDTSDIAGLDSDPHTGALLATLTVSGTPGLYTIDRATGHATLVGAMASPPIGSLTIDTQGLPRLTLLTPVLPNQLFNAFLNPIAESTPTVDWLVERSGDDTVAADYLVQTVNGTAQAGLDYVGKSEVIHFAAGETQKTVSVALINDTLIEGAESLSITVAENVPSSPTASATVTIMDDDNPPPVLTITSPSVPITVGTASITIAGTVTDDEPGAFVRMILGAEVPLFPHPLVAVRTDNPWTFESVPLSLGLNVIYFQGLDAHGAAVLQRVEIARVTEQTYYFAEGFDRRILRYRSALLESESQRCADHDRLLR